MRQPPKLDPDHHGKRSALRTVGPVIMVIGGIFLAIGLIDFFSAFGGHGSPTKFWCCFVGLPLLAIGGMITQAGYMGAMGRYAAGEMAPVAKDTFNYMAHGTQDGVRTVAQAVGEGLGLRGSAPATVALCHKCNHENDTDAKFCNDCGAALAKAKPCVACNELNDPDAQFCDDCGTPFA
ncbi:zinc ribbon domain-containing protein [bacterium]|nr:zinc ribbon domain-containing protein [bacterium]